MHWLAFPTRQPRSIPQVDWLTRNHHTLYKVILGGFGPASWLAPVISTTLAHHLPWSNPVLTLLAQDPSMLFYSSEDLGAVATSER